MDHRHHVGLGLDFTWMTGFTSCLRALRNLIMSKVGSRARISLTVFAISVSTEKLSVISCVIKAGTFKTAHPSGQADNTPQAICSPGSFTFPSQSYAQHLHNASVHSSLMAGRVRSTAAPILPHVDGVAKSRCKRRYLDAVHEG